MATKNLGRSAVEGGRTGWYKVRAQEIETSLRTSSRKYEHRVQNDVDAWEDEAEPVRRPYGKKGNQTDKLSGVYRMLDKMVGRPWAKVYAEICQKFDGRTLAGRHVLVDHILRDIAPNEDDAKLHYANYYIDSRGLFQKRPRTRYHYNMDRLSKAFAVEIEEWLGGRGIIRVGSKLYWAMPSNKSPVLLVLSGYQGDVVNLSYQVFGYFYQRWGWRQGLPLSQKDEKFFASIPKFFQGKLIARDSVQEAA